MSQNKASGKIWRLRRGMDRRFRSGHPWVYSNELEESPKGIEPGSLIELRDSTGKFLARGFGNSHSLIAFRALSRNSEETDPSSFESVFKAIKAASELRGGLGLSEFSHRLCFGEADGLPGLIIDYFPSRTGQVFVVQAHSAGADRLLPSVLESLERLVDAGLGAFRWDQTAIVLRNDLSVRKLEGLTEDEPKVVKEFPGLNLKDCAIRVRPALDSILEKDPLIFQTDLLTGQKTGFFLDQSSNIQLAALRFQHLFPERSSIRILDLCCYVGQWGAQLARVFRSKGIQSKVVAVDASAPALEFARRNVIAQGSEFESLKGDVLKNLGNFDTQSFDIVISDPPAHETKRLPI